MATISSVSLTLYISVAKFCTLIFTVIYVSNFTSTLEALEIGLRETDNYYGCMVVIVDCQVTDRCTNRPVLQTYHIYSPE
jgi:hypothetical protein